MNCQNLLKSTGDRILLTFFFKYLFEEEEQICQILSNFKPLKLSVEEKRSFQNATIGNICRNDLGSDRSERPHAFAPLHL